MHYFLAIINWITATQTAYAVTIPNVNSRTNKPIAQEVFSTNTTFDTALYNIWNGLFHIVYLLFGIIAVALLIWAGIQYITSNGNPERVKKARQSIVNIVLGIILLGSSYAIIAFILGIIGSAASVVAP
jgi:hypothetical protein